MTTEPTITLPLSVIERAYKQLVHAASAFKLAKTSRDELRAALASTSEQRTVTPADLVDDLAAIATGRIVHLENGACPNQVVGESVRDVGCPACQVLIRLAALG